MYDNNIKFKSKRAFTATSGNVGNKQSTISDQTLRIVGLF